MRLFIKQNERQLLLYSQIVNDYPWLRDLLEQNEKISNELVKSFSKEKQEFIKTMFQRILKLASEEWERDNSKAVKDLGKDKQNWIKCSLDNRPNRFVFYIKNYRNGISLNVGSECIEKFDLISKKDRIQLQKEAIRTRRLAKLNKIIPNVEEIIKNWDRDLKKQLIIIPSNLSVPYIQVGDKAKELFNKILDEESANVNELNSLLKQQKELLLKIDNYVNEHKDKPFIPNKKVEFWLKNKNTMEAREALENLQKLGKTTIFSIHRIREKEFMELLIPELNLVLKGVKVESADYLREGYVYYLLKQKDIKLFCKHKILLEEYGGKILGEEPDYVPNFPRIIVNSKVYDDLSYSNIIDYVQDSLKNVRIKYNYDHKEILLEVTNDERTYYIIPLQSFGMHFKTIGLLTNKQANEQLSKLIKTAKGYSKLELAKWQKPVWIPWNKILPSDEDKLNNLKENYFDIFYDAI
ncbi:MAG: hypothetical protein ACOX2N_09415 [Peptococcia bacterium]|jgi:hypothetical protein